MVSLLPTKFHEILFSSFGGVALTNWWTGQKQYVSPSIDYSMLQGYLNWMWSQSLTPFGNILNLILIVVVVSCVKALRLSLSGADPRSPVRGAGGTLKKIVPSGERREIFGGISCEKSRFYAKKSYFIQLRREARKIWGYFVWKITILLQKNHIFPILGGRTCRVCPPPP